MGYGDEIIGSGLARGAYNRGKLIAFGDGKKIIWSDQAKMIYQNNPNVAPLETHTVANPKLQWIPYYRGHRFYGEIKNNKWVFVENGLWTCPKGELFFSNEEKEFGLKHAREPFVVIEPRVKIHGATAGVNKQWPVDRYAAVAGYLNKIGIRVVQFVPTGSKKLLLGIEVVETPNIRFAFSVLEHADLYIGPEGALHHGAAALGTNAVVIFGGFNSPKATGYAEQVSLAVGEPCGSIHPCVHCREAMNSITVDEVIDHAMKFVGNKHSVMA